MKTISGSLKAHLAADVTTLCTLWRIERKDGVVMGFTDHDVDLTYEGLTYSAESGYMRSALTNDASLSVDTVELSGFLDHDGIEFYDLRNGVYDYAKVRISLVNWNDLSQGTLEMRTGQFGEVIVTNNGDFRVELNGLTRHLSQKIGQQFTPECRASLGDKRCKIETSPALRSSRKRYAVGERMRVAVGDRSSIVLQLQNPSFEEPLEDVGSVPTTTVFYNPNDGYIPGWDMAGRDRRAQGFYQGANGVYGPTDGLNFALPERPMSQTVNIAVDPAVDLGVVDGGFYDLVLSYDVIGIYAGTSINDGGTTEIREGSSIGFLNGAGLTIGGTIFSPVLPAMPARVFRPRTFRVAVPAATRSIVIGQVIYAPATSRALGYDNYEARLVDRRYGEGTYDQFQNLEWRCLQAGVTDSVPPAFPTMEGTVVADGGVVWQAELAKYSHTAQLAAIESRQAFFVSGLGIPDGFYAYGTATFETGPNRGRVVEVKAWTSANQRIELFLPLTFEPAVGDIVRLTAGCDGRRETCAERFANIFNFRGEPDVPGSDKYLDVGNPRG